MSSIKWPWRTPDPEQEAADVARSLDDNAPDQVVRVVNRRVSRDYYAGQWTDLTMDWGTTTESMYQVTLQNLSTLRARARKEVRANDYATKFVGMVKNGVVGPNGFKLVCHFRNGTNQPDPKAAAAFQASFAAWANDPRACDVRGRMTFKQILNTIVGSLPSDGEFFVRRWLRGPRDFQLQVIDPVLCDHTFNDDLPSGRKVRAGVELDEFAKPVAYYFNDPNKALAGGYFPHHHADRLRVPAEEIYHGFVDVGIDQIRGIPWLGTPMYRMHMLNGYEEAAAVNARVGASKMAFHKKSSPDGYAGTVPETEGGAIDETRPGGIEEIGADDDMIFWDPKYPQSEYEGYLKSMLRGVAAGLMASYTTLSGDLSGVSYNSLRHDRLETADTWMLLQEWLVDAFLRQFWLDWRLVQVSREHVKIPRGSGGSRPARFSALDRYGDVTWRGRRWAWVDPQKEIQAHREALEMKITTRSKIIRDLGEDPEEIFAEWELENERFGPIEPREPASGGSGDPEPSNDGAEGDSGQEQPNG